MLNKITFSGDVKSVSTLEELTVVPSNLFSQEVVENLHMLRDNKIDNLIIRGLPVPENIPETPTKIRAEIPDLFPKYLLNGLGNFIGDISEKGIENSIRFSTTETGMTNVETWHGHPQFAYSIFYCLRGDENAKAYFLSANDIVANASQEEQNILLDSNLVRHKGGRYEFSQDIYQPSDFQQQIENLDLPDTTKALNTNREDEAFSFLLTKMLQANEKIVYQPGDLAIYNERQTMRFSPAYISSTQKGKERWLLGIGVY